ncbi:hypothetical protein AAC387_Pa04g2524 [Persea americana]
MQSNGSPEAPPPPPRRRLSPNPPNPPRPRTTPPPTPTALASPNRSPASLSNPPKLKLAQPKISPTEQLVQQQEEMIDHFSNRRTLVSIRDLAKGITYTEPLGKERERRDEKNRRQRSRLYSSVPIQTSLFFSQRQD